MLKKQPPLFFLTEMRDFYSHFFKEIAVRQARAHLVTR